MAANFEQGTELRPTGSKLDLIQATVAAISRARPFGADLRQDCGRCGPHRRFDQLSLRQQGSAAARDAPRGVRGIRRRHGARDGGGGRRRLARAPRHHRREPRPGLERLPQDRRLVCVPRRVQGARRLPAHLRRARFGLEPDGHRPLQAPYLRARQRIVAGCRGGGPGLDGPHRPAVAGDPVRGRRLRPRSSAPPVPRLSLQRLSLARAAHRGDGTRAQPRACARGRRRPGDSR